MSTNNDYDIGDLVRLKGTFTNTITNAVDDPTVVTCVVKNPNLTKTELTFGISATLIRESKGIYYTDFPPTMEGLHWYKFQGTGNVTASEELSFYVRPRNTA